MKLYTEIQLLEAIDKASLPNMTILDILESLTPIELPSDERTMSNNYCQFEPSTNTSSATICKWCGKEKFMHNLIPEQISIKPLNNNNMTPRRR